MKFSRIRKNSDLLWLVPVQPFDQNSCEFCYGNAGEIATAPTGVPNCGAEMVLRTASQGTRRGEAFYGRRNYPRCGGMVPAG